MAKEKVIGIDYKETDGKEEVAEKKHNKFLDFCSNHIVPVAGAAVVGLAAVLFILYTVFSSIGDSDIGTSEDKEDDGFDVDFTEVSSEDVTVDEV